MTKVISESHLCDERCKMSDINCLFCHTYRAYDKIAYMYVMAKWWNKIN